MSSGTESIADDSGTCRGVVLSRAATILRSIETQPSTGRFVPQQEQPSGEGGQRQGKALTLSRVFKFNQLTSPPKILEVRLGGCYLLRRLFLYVMRDMERHLEWLGQSLPEVRGSQRQNPLGQGEAGHFESIGL